MNAGGTNQTRLTADGSDDAEPSFGLGLPHPAEVAALVGQVGGQITAAGGPGTTASFGGPGDVCGSVYDDDAYLFYEDTQVGLDHQVKSFGRSVGGDSGAPVDKQCCYGSVTGVGLVSGGHYETICMGFCSCTYTANITNFASLPRIDQEMNLSVAR